MRRRFLTLSAVAMTAITLLIPTLASASQHTDLPENVIFAEHTRSAVSVFERTEGCLTTSIFLRVSEYKQAWNDGTRDNHRQASIGIYQEDICLDDVILDVEFESDDMAFDIANRLSGAALKGQFMANDGAGGEQPVSVNVRWNPTGPRVNYQFADEVMVENPLTGEHGPALQEERQTERPAKVRGTITVGDQTFSIVDRSETTFFIRFDLTWTLLAQ